MFNFKKHNSSLYSTLLRLSRNIYFFYDQIQLKDSFENRLYLMIIHFSIILQIFKRKKSNFYKKITIIFFFSIENDLRELGFGDVTVNKKMKDINKIFYDILLKINSKKNNFEINKKIIFKYFIEFKDSNYEKYELFNRYFNDFYDFCFELTGDNMIKDVQ